MSARSQLWPVALALAAPLLIGVSLMAYSLVAYQRRRRALLLALRRDTLPTPR